MENLEEKYRKDRRYGGYSGYKNSNEKKAYENQKKQQRDKYNDVNSDISESEELSLGLNLEDQNDDLKLNLNL